MQTWQLCWIELAKLDLFLLKAVKYGQKCMLFTKIIFPRSVCWTVEKQFWQVCRNKFAILRNFFCSKPKKIDKFVFILPIDFTWKYLMDTKKAILTAMPKHFCRIRGFFGSKCGKIWTNLEIFQWTDFSPECFVDIKQCNSDNSAAMISQKNEVLSAESGNWSKNCKFFKGNYILRKVALDTEKAVLTLFPI